jgi:hypothetical protein
MDLLIIGLVWLLNFGISVWNAYAVGKSWVEARVAGGWPRLLCWAGAVMSACGFTWCYLIVLALVAYHFEYLNAEQITVSLSLGYILLIPGILLSGLVITLDSWARAFRQGGFLNYGLAAYNTYAQIHNTYHAITGLGQAFGTVGDFFKDGGSSRDRDRPAWVLVVLLVALALAAGVLTTTVIIWRVAGNLPLPPPPTPRQLEDSARNVEGVRR